MFRRRAQGSRRDDGSAGDGLGAASGRAASGREASAAAGVAGSVASAGADGAAGVFGSSETLGSLGSLGWVPAGVDGSVAHPARIWNYWLGGRDYFAADRAAGYALGQEFPHVTEIARAERAFLVRAVRLPGQQVRQFLDIGAGLPATHEIAQRISPDSGIVYVDHDPVVLAHARALLQPDAGKLAEGGRLHPGRPARRGRGAHALGAYLDHGKPVALMMLGVLGYIDDYGKAARSIASQIMDALPSGSYLAIADGVAVNGYVESMQQRYNQVAATAYRLQRPDELASFFDGLNLVDPGWCRARGGSRTCVRLLMAGRRARRSPTCGVAQEVLNGPSARYALGALLGLGRCA